MFISRTAKKSGSGKQAKKSLAVLTATALSAAGKCVTAFAGEPGSMDLSGREVWLDGCAVVLAGATQEIALQTELPGHCELVLNGNGSLRVVEDGNKKVFLVFSSREKNQVGLCDTRLRAIVVEGERVSLSERTMEISACRVTDMDEKMYLVLGYNTLPPSE